MISSACPIACSALTPSSRSAARFHDVTYLWPSVVTIASPAAATAADARAGSAAIGRSSAIDIDVSLSPAALPQSRTDRDHVSAGEHHGRSAGCRADAATLRASRQPWL